ncbi:hypothetical protein B0A50_01472 [Salinomyces thailandicus]|uniref:Knr4/Smi1-like domain-containing protein n=1 Tax=Salinomyces thailandicus TaxID=706561 RepID=A0A4U0UCV1_9PEZI|nr:hypothetical protein B0A50_01472 [Salinomyces thailandica]
MADAPTAGSSSGDVQKALEEFTMADASNAGSSPGDVQKALEEYRKTVLASNQASLTWLVRRLEAMQPSEPMDDEEINERKLEVLQNYLGIDPEPEGLPDLIQRPGDALEHMDSLTRIAGLDGVILLDEGATGSRDERIAHYLDVFNRALNEHAVKEFQGRLSVPAEFRTMMQQVDAVLGAGLPCYRDLFQIAFYGGNSFPPDGGVNERVLQLEGDTDANYVLCLDDDWEVAAGWITGSGLPGDCYALYCRSVREGLDWAWRYHVGARDQTNFEPTADLAAFLTLYARYEEPNERDLEDAEGAPFA